jgi:zinc protease
MKRARIAEGILTAAALAAFLCLSCATGGPTEAAKVADASMGTGSGAKGFPLAGAGASFDERGLSAFAKESLPSFSTFTLSNGLPVIVKKSSANRVQHISLVIRGGSAAASAGKAGVEALALKVMARGSGKRSYEEIETLLDETSSGLGSSSSFDYSAYSLTTLDKYFERLFPVWVDTLVDPSFKESDFEQELSEARLALESKEQDPWAKTGLVANRILFAGHPYAASPDGTAESLASVTLGDLKAWYAARLRADALFVVAVGDFDPVGLRAKLEAGLGRLPSAGAPLPAVAPLGRTGAWSLDKVEFPQSRGMGYLRGDFVAPSYSDPDYMGLSIGMRMLTDLLFNVVRDKYGAVYSANAYIRGFRANYGSLALFKTKNPGAAKAHIDEAVAVIASGKAVALDPKSSKDGYAPIADVLEAEKARFVNELYESQATNAAIAGRIAESVIATGDYRSYLLDVDRIRAVTPEQVKAALDKYLLKGSIAWVALGSADVLIPAQSVDFEGFTGMHE